MILGDIRSALASPLDPSVDPGDCRLASVLVVIYGDEPLVVMTEKPKSMRFHAGEISFPGGKPEPGDSDLLDTALRETREEIGLEIKREQVAGQLEPVITLNSGFKILPFVAVVDDISPLLPNREVEEILYMPLGPLLDTMGHDPDPSHNVIREMFTFGYGNKTVWGASARILKQMHDMLRP